MGDDVTGTRVLQICLKSMHVKEQAGHSEGADAHDVAVATCGSKAAAMAPMVKVSSQFGPAVTWEKGGKHS